MWHKLRIGSFLGSVSSEAEVLWYIILQVVWTNCNYLFIDRAAVPLPGCRRAGAHETYLMWFKLI